MYNKQKYKVQLRRINKCKNSRFKTNPKNKCKDKCKNNIKIMKLCRNNPKKMNMIKNKSMISLGKELHCFRKCPMTRHSTIL